MEWKYKENFSSAEVLPWTVGGKEAGTIQSANGFTFLRIYDAGHMVPRDQPAAALDMLQKFMQGSLGSH